MPLIPSEAARSPPPGSPRPHELWCRSSQSSPPPSSSGGAEWPGLASGCPRRTLQCSLPIPACCHELFVWPQLPDEAGTGRAAGTHPPSPYRYIGQHGSVCVCVCVGGWEAARVRRRVGVGGTGRYFWHSAPWGALGKSPRSVSPPRDAHCHPSSAMSAPRRLLGPLCPHSLGGGRRLLSPPRCLVAPGVPGGRVPPISPRPPGRTRAAPWTPCSRTTSAS